MISREDAGNTLIIRREKGQTRPLVTTQEAISIAINDAEHQSEILFEMGNASEILFSERVILFEGSTEKAVIPDLFLTVMGKTLQSERIGTVFLNGSSNIPDSMKILETMGIPVKAVVDLDFAFKDAVRHGILDKDNSSITACKTIFEKLKDGGKLDLAENGLPKKSGDMSASQGFELLAEQDDAKPNIEKLHEELLAQGYWLWQKGAIEKHLELRSKTSGEHARFVRQLQSDGFFETLTDSKNIMKLCKWLID
jgi:predicted ATP-dependent endonuclease of OLD family